MKLALIRRRFSATGGAELYVERLLTALAERGHELHLFAEAWDQTPANVTVHRLSESGSRATRPVRFADSVQRALAQERFDCVFSLERTRRQDVYRAGDGVHRVWLQRRRQFAPGWKKPFVGLGAFHRNILRLESETFDPTNTRHVIVNSEMVRREILDHFGFPADRIHLVRNGVDVARFQHGKRAETRARFGVNDDELLLLFVGSGWERKGLKYVLEAVEQIAVMQASNDPMLDSIVNEATKLGILVNAPAPKVKLLVVGKGKPMRTRIGNVIFAGPISAVENVYAAADLFVFLPIYEPSSNVVIEALAAGLPVVASVYDGAAEVIKPGETGTVIDRPDDSTAVIQAIADWSKRRFGRRGFATDGLALDRNVSETLAVLELVAAEKSK